MKESLSLRFLYHTACGRFILKLLVTPKISEFIGSFLNCGFSRFLIDPFIRKHKISTKNIDIPANGFKSFNDFFIRGYKEDPFTESGGKFLRSPCEAFMSCFSIDGSSRFRIKHVEYSLKDLLDDAELAESFENGTALVFRLTPSHYHRYHFVDDGEILKRRSIKGVLHCVRPVATDHYPVYMQNSREYVMMNTKRFGQIVQMEIGALMVGKIHNHNNSEKVYEGEEKGYFEFGGSTIILLLQKDNVEISGDLMKKESFGIEVPVKIGQVIGIAI